MNGECSKTGKQRYATARAAHVAIRTAYWGRRTTKQPKRVYFCKRCQGYHLSSNGDLWTRRERLSREHSGRSRLSNMQRPASKNQRAVAKTYDADSGMNQPASSSQHPTSDDESL